MTVSGPPFEQRRGTPRTRRSRFDATLKHPMAYVTFVCLETRRVTAVKASRAFVAPRLMSAAGAMT